MQVNKSKHKNITVSRIFRLVKENTLTTKEFSNKVGIRQVNITDWETLRTKPFVSVLIKIEKTYKVQLECLTEDSKYVTKEEFMKLK